MAQANDKKQLAFTVRLEGDMEQKFFDLKKRYGFVSNSDLIRLLITQAYDALIKTPLDR